MKIKTTLVILFLCFCQNLWGQEVTAPNLKLKSGNKFEIGKVFCENLDTIYFRLRGSLKYYKTAKSDIAMLDNNALNNYQIRHFSVHRESRIGIYLERLGAVVVGSTVSITTLLAISANKALTWSMINASAIAGGVPGLIIFIHAQNRANDYRAYRMAVELE